ncbi:MAG: GntR family transcriptional regulator [Anaerolineae bacterium]
MDLFNRPESRTLRNEVVDLLRDAIVQGELKPGQHLKENELAELMSVSRSPIREALRQLEQEGLVVSVPNQGSTVREFNEQDIREIFTIRASLETLASEIVIQKQTLTPKDLEHLQSCIERQKKLIAARDYDRLTKADMEFHDYVFERAGFRRLVKMWQSLRAQMQVLFLMRFQAFPDYVPETVDTDHQALLDALSHGDVEALRDLHREINTRVAEECVQIIYSGLPADAFPKQTAG